MLEANATQAPKGEFIVVEPENNSLFPNLALYDGRKVVLFSHEARYEVTIMSYMGEPNSLAVLNRLKRMDQEAGRGLVPVELMSTRELVDKIGNASVVMNQHDSNLP